MTNTMRAYVGEIVLRPAPAVEIMGDSVSAELRASLIAEPLGDPAWTVANYSLPGTSPLFAPATFDRQCAAGRVPKVIVYAPHPANLGAPMVDRFVGRFATLSEARSLPRVGVSWPDFAFGALCKASYTMRYREELNAFVTQGDGGFFKTWRNPIRSVAESEEPFGEAPREPDTSVKKYTPANLPPQLTQPFSVHPYNRAAIDRFLDRASEKGVTVLWVSLPTIAPLTQDAKERARFDAFLDDTQQRHANFSVLHRGIETWPDAYFSDPRHVNRFGAWKFSRQLGAELAAWVKTTGADPLRGGSAREPAPLVR